MNDTRILRRSDPDFPTTRAAQQRLVAAGRVAGEGALRHHPPTAQPAAPRPAPVRRSLDAPEGPCIPLGETDRGTLHLDLNGLLAGRCLIQGSSGAGKSATIRHIIEEALRRLGYGRGWGCPWQAEEDDLLRQAYARGDNLTPLQDRLGRTRTAIANRAGELGLRGTHVLKNGWRTKPAWTGEQLEQLRAGYGKLGIAALARQIGRPRSAIYNKAFQLGLKSGHHRPFDAREEAAIRLARDRGVSPTDLSAALARDAAVVAKHAQRMGIPFATRLRPAPRGVRAGRTRVTLKTLLALAEQPSLAPRPVAPIAAPAIVPLMLAMPDMPSMPEPILRAMHEAGLIGIAVRAPGTLLTQPNRR